MNGRSVFASLLALWLLLAALGPAAAAQNVPAAVQGRLQLAAVPADPLPLQGQWGFAWQRFVDPAWEQLPASAFAQVPASWNDLAADGKPRGGDGWGSYVLQVDCPRGQTMAMEAVGQRTAGRFYVNGELVGQHGEPGATARASWAAVYNRIPISREFACPLRVTLHVSNFDHRAGGFVRPIWVGTAEDLHLQREARVIFEAPLLAAYLITGMVALIFFAVLRRGGTVPLVYGLFCLSMAVYTDLISERLLLRSLPPQVSWRAFMGVEYLSWIAAMALFLLTLRSLFPQEIHKRFVQVAVGVLATAGVAVVLLPPGVYSYVALPGQAVAVVISLYLAWALFKAQQRTPVDARILLAGMAAIVVAQVLDLVFLESLGPGRKFGPIGFALFLLSPAVVMARRLGRALSAEERNRTLEENARLREDVERMSRHDLKTPLSSILGAARLLQDDTALNGDQKELVGVLQRAGIRMLEMVNLSLDLFKMETGSYSLRAQAVDLRQVVTRVMVDLHPYADANEVTLHLQDTGIAPIYVRGEELLCYSIIANLVKNAVEAAGAFKQVTLDLRRGDPVAVTVHNPGEVPAEIASQFFQKYATSGKSGGTGLGTYSARLMARAQQGELELHTSAVAGTTLTLTLPPLKEVAADPLPEPEVERPAALWVSGIPARTVLLADDDEFTRLVMRRFLPNPPFSVETVANGQAAIDAMRKRWPDYLLLDMEMPVKGGVETVRWARENEGVQGRRPCRIVMLSGNDDEASHALALGAGADRFLVKPVSRERLLSTLRELEGGLPLRDLAASGWGALAPILPAEVHQPSSEADEIITVEPEWAEVFPDFVKLQRETVEAMARALAAGERQDVQFLAHRATGGLATMGLNWAARQARFVENNALEAADEELQLRIDSLQEHLGKVRMATA